MVSYKGMSLKERLEQKIIDEELKALYKETEEIKIIFPEEEYLEFIKKDRHPMAYTVKQEIEEEWRFAPLRLNLDESLSMFWLFTTGYGVFWSGIGLWVAIQLLTA